MIWPQVKCLQISFLSFTSQTPGCSCHSRLLRLSSTLDRISRFLLLIGKIDPISSCYLSSGMSVIWVPPPLSVQTGNTVWHDYIKLTQSSHNSPEKRVEIYELHNLLHTYTPTFINLSSPLFLTPSFFSQFIGSSFIFNEIISTHCLCCSVPVAERNTKRWTEKHRPHDERERERMFHSHESVISVWWANLTPDQISCPVCCFSPIDGAISELRSCMCVCVRLCECVCELCVCVCVCVCGLSMNPARNLMTKTIL